VVGGVAFPRLPVLARPSPVLDRARLGGIRLAAQDAGRAWIWSSAGGSGVASETASSCGCHHLVELFRVRHHVVAPIRRTPSSIFFICPRGEGPEAPAARLALRYVWLISGRGQSPPITARRAHSNRSSLAGSRKGNEKQEAEFCLPLGSGRSQIRLACPPSSARGHAIAPSPDSRGGSPMSAYMGA